MLKFTKRDYKFINKNVCIRKFKLFKKLKGHNSYSEVNLKKKIKMCM